MYRSTANRTNILAAIAGDAAHCREEQRAHRTVLQQQEQTGRRETRELTEAEKQPLIDAAELRKELAELAPRAVEKSRRREDHRHLRPQALKALTGRRRQARRQVSNILARRHIVIPRTTLHACNE